MIIDPLDIKILKIFYDLKQKEETTTWKIMNKIFPNLRNKYEKEAKHNLIKSRIKRMPDLFKIKKANGFLEYELIGSDVRFCKHRFPNGIKNCLMLKSDGAWAIHQL